MQHTNRIANLVRKQSLLAYAVAALSFVASCADANAALVVQYIDVTISNDRHGLDLNQDGELDYFINDFEGFATIVSTAATSRAAVLLQQNLHYAQNFPVGGTVGGNFVNSHTNAYLFGDSSFDSPLPNVGDTTYFGLHLYGGRNYGWVEITRGSTIIGRAGYETTPFTGAVVVPEPSSLSLLAICTVGLTVPRLRRRAAREGKCV